MPYKKYVALTIIWFVSIFPIHIEMANHLHMITTSSSEIKRLRAILPTKHHTVVICKIMIFDCRDANKKVNESIFLHMKTTVARIYRKKSNYSPNVLTVKSVSHSLQCLLCGRKYWLVIVNHNVGRVYLNDVGVSLVPGEL